MSKKRLLIIPSDTFGVGNFRFIEPHIELQKQFGDEFYIDINIKADFMNAEYINSFDLIIGHKDMCPPDKAEIIFHSLRERGIKIILDLDDHYNIPPTHPQYHYAKHIKYSEKVISMLKLVDYITTTTETFAKDLRQHNKNVIVFPNGIDPTGKKYQIKEEKTDKIRVGFLGGSSHLHDLMLLKPMFNSINEKYQDKIQTVLCGFDTRGETYDTDENGQQFKRPFKPKEVCWYDYEKIFTSDYKYLDKNYFDWLMKFKQEEYPDVQNQQYRRVWTKPLSTYSLNYNLFDISVAPLVTNKFNQVKSPLKIEEAGFFKKAIICSDIEPYREDIIHGYNGFLVNNNNKKQDWKYYMSKLIENPELIKEMGENLYNTVKDKYDLRNISRQRAEWYKEITAKVENTEINE